MKNIFLFFLLFFLSIAAFSNTGELERKSVIPYKIKSRIIEKNLPEGKSKFNFIFYTENGIYKKQLQIGIGDSSFNAIPNWSGYVPSHINNGKYILYFYLDGYYEVITDTITIKSKEVVEIEVRFEKADPNMIITVDKPVIYIYSDTEKEMEIKLDVNGKLGFTWPVYHEAWNFTATPEGKIKMDGKEFNYLFWESEMPEYALDKASKEGFLVATDTLLSFLENSLEKMNFTASESADFITFWYPQMIKNEKNHIQFLFNESCDTYARLNISPLPDHIFRVGMVWCDAKNSGVIPNEQIIPSVKREGTTVIEWGGMETESIFEKGN
jgi:hypothetical protein